MKETKTTIIKTIYEGNCPICGKEQINELKYTVDTICYDCANKELEAALKHLSELGINVKYTNYNSIYIDSIEFEFSDNRYEIECDGDTGMEIHRI